jgi:hypothetical protein
VMMGVGSSNCSRIGCTLLWGDDDDSHPKMKGTTAISTCSLFECKLIVVPYVVP